MKFSQEEVEKLADLARLSLSDEEATLYQKQLGDVLAYVDKINKLDLGEIKESLSGTEDKELDLRPDQSVASEPEAISQAHELKDDYMVSPKVFDN